MGIAIVGAEISRNCEERSKKTSRNCSSFLVKLARNKNIHANATGKPNYTLQKTFVYGANIRVPRRLGFCAPGVFRDFCAF